MRVVWAMAIISDKQKIVRKPGRMRLKTKTGWLSLSFMEASLPDFIGTVTGLISTAKVIIDDTVG